MFPLRSLSQGNAGHKRTKDINKNRVHLSSTKADGGKGVNHLEDEGRDVGVFRHPGMEPKGES